MSKLWKLLGLSDKNLKWSRDAQAKIDRQWTMKSIDDVHDRLGDGGNRAF